LILASCPTTWRSAAVVFREVNMVEVREVLRGWLNGVGLRTVAARAGVDRKTARRYVQAAQEAGLTRNSGLAALDDELIGVVVGAVRPARPNGHGDSWEILLAHQERIPLRTAARRCPEVMFLAGRPGVADGAACQESQGGHSLGRTRESLSGRVSFG
jgi:hypothetical protein